MSSEEYLRGWNDAIKYMSALVGNSYRHDGHDGHVNTQSDKGNENVVIARTSIIKSDKTEDRPHRMIRPQSSNVCYGNSLMQALMACGVVSFDEFVTKDGDIDASDFYKEFLNRYGNNDICYTRQNDAEEFFTLYIDRNPELEKMFMFKISSTLICNGCRKRSVKKTAENMMRLPNHFSGNLISGLNRYVGTENVMYRCTCGITSAVKYHELESKPDILMVMYMRYEYDLATSRKIKVENKINIDGKFRILGSVYNLVAVVEHIGVSAHSGHYVALVNHSSNWWRCDDSNIQIINNISSRLNGNTSAHLMFYVRE